MGTKERISGRLFLAPGLVLYLGPGVIAEEHRHHATQIVVGLEERVTLGSAEGVRHGQAFLVPSDLPHRLSAGPGRAAIALIEPEGSFGQRLEAAAVRFEGRDLAEFAGRVGPPGRDPSAEEALSWIEELARSLVGTWPPAPAIRSEVAHALDCLNRLVPQGRVSLGDLADEVGLSSSRLSHVFSKQAGLPFSSYVLWLRVKLAVEAVRTGSNLTEAAAAAGFSDQAHLARTFRATFGLPPSRALAGFEIVGGLWGGEPA